MTEQLHFHWDIQLFCRQTETLDLLWEGVQGLIPGHGGQVWAPPLASIPAWGEGLLFMAKWVGSRPPPGSSDSTLAEGARVPYHCPMWLPLTSRVVQGGSLESSPGFPAGEGRMPITTVGRANGRPGFTWFPGRVHCHCCWEGSNAPSPYLVSDITTAGCVCVLCSVDAKGWDPHWGAWVAGLQSSCGWTRAVGVHSLLLTKCWGSDLQGTHYWLCCSLGPRKSACLLSPFQSLLGFVYM